MESTRVLSNQDSNGVFIKGSRRASILGLSGDRFYLRFGSGKVDAGGDTALVPRVDECVNFSVSVSCRR